MTATALPRHRTVAVAAALLAVLATLLVPGTAVAADAGAEGALVAATNRERAAAGLSSLSVAGDLVAVARQHSVRMADSTDLHHNPALGSHVSGWQKVGENVGRGPSVDAIQQAFMSSPDHRTNVLDAAWTQVGVGVEVREGRMWVTVVFRQAEAAPAPEPTSAPAPQPQTQPAGTPADAPVDGPATPTDTSPERSTTPAAPEPSPEPTTPDAPAGDRALVMLTRVAAEDASIDAA